MQPTRHTGLDRLPFATVLVAAALLILWAARDERHEPGATILAAELPRWQLEASAAEHLPPRTPWGSRTVGEVLERLLDPPQRDELEPRRPVECTTEPPEDAGAPPEPPRPMVVFGPGGESVAQGPSRDGLPDGAWEFRYAGGGVRARGEFRLGAPHGRWSAWHENGSPSVEIGYQTGQPEGLLIEWWPNGVKRREGAYVDGLREGCWRAWHENGVLRSEGGYHLGLRIGEWLEWHGNALPSIASSYADGRRQGQWSAWHESGAKAEDGWFEAGLREGPWGFFSPLGVRERRSGFYVHGVRQ